MKNFKSIAPTQLALVEGGLLQDLRALKYLFRSFRGVEKEYGEAGAQTGIGILWEGLRGKFGFNK